MLADGAVKVGQAVAQLAAKEWLNRRRKKQERTASLAELAAAELSSPVQRGTLENALNGIGYRAAGELESLLGVRFDGLPEHEVTAAIDAVVDALRETDLSDETLLAADADPERLAGQIRRQLPGQTSVAGLSAHGSELYEVVLDQACRYLVQVVRHLPSFQPRALAEVLDRLSTVSGQLTDVLARTPRTSLYAPRGTTHDDEFRAEYLRYLATAVDKLDLLGLTMKHRPKLALSMAYLSLTVSEQDTNRRARRSRDHFGDHWFGREIDRDRTSTVRVEAAIGDAQRTLVRGEAGSGKTTLLDWLAVTAARSGFTGQLQDWNGCVPFLVRLRRHVDTALPRPEHFLDHSAAPLAGITPKGWVHRCLDSGQALVLVDGVDEVPPAKRRSVRTWLSELVTAYPKSRVVVTARPAAADQKWLAEEGFSSVILEQMSASDIQLFLERWHEAAEAAESLPCEPQELPAAKRRLRTQLDARPHLRALAANPLLCAMLCALNLGRTSELPRNRMELYRAALTMLLDLRDAERNIPGLLDATEKTALLRDLAWRLTLGNRNELARAKVLEHVTRKLPAMPNVDEEPESVLDHLLERSGVLREPLPGRVDFVHRTFQEYLAASEATEEEHIDTLVSHAHLDSWRETIVMACGYAKRSQLRDLLTAILDRADTEYRYARQLRLLTAACLEAITDMDPDVRGRIDQVIIEKLVPPKSTRETRSLAGIGHRILRYLPNTLDDLSEAAAAATVRTAALTNNHEALARLCTYSQDQRFSVQREIINAWHYFDPKRYANEVLVDAPFHNGEIIITSKRFLPHLEQLSHLTTLTVWLPDHETLESPDILADLPHLNDIQVRCTGSIDLTLLSEHPRLRRIWMAGADSCRNTHALEHLPNLTKLSLFRQKPWPNIDFIATLPSLRELLLDELHDITDFQALQALTLMDRLYLYECAKLRTFDPIQQLHGLRHFAVSRCKMRNLEEQIPAHFPGIRTLIANRTAVSNLAPLSQLKPNYLSIAGCPAENLDPLSSQDSIRRLNILQCPNIRDLRPLANKSMVLHLSPGQEYQGLDQLGPGVEIHYR